MSGEPLSTAGGLVGGFLHRPAEPSDPAGPYDKGLVLTHGAGGNCESPLLIKTASAFASAGFLVYRCDLPFRRKKRSGPPFPAQSAEDRKGLRQAAGDLRRLGARSVFLGGHSYGGRQASILAAEDPAAADGLLLLSYPLHPPKKLEQLRTAHFPQLRLPCLFVHGARDPFGSIQEMQAALEAMPAPVRLTIVDRAGHDLAGVDILEVVKNFQSLIADPLDPPLEVRGQ